jgi:hypothetical protein
MMNIPVILCPASAVRGRKADIAKFLELMVWGLWVLLTPDDVIQDDIGIHFKPIGVGDSAETHEAVFTAESRRHHAFLIFIPEIVMSKDVVSHAAGPADSTEWLYEIKQPVDIGSRGNRCGFGSPTRSAPVHS